MIPIPLLARSETKKSERPPINAYSSPTAPSLPILRSHRKCDAMADLNVSLA